MARPASITGSRRAGSDSAASARSARARPRSSRSTATAASTSRPIPEPDGWGSPYRSVSVTAARAFRSALPSQPFR